MASDVLKLCYNKGCGQKFTEEDNNDNVCTYHPGVPVFHDALKGWSCCKKRSTDFTDFLHIPGCTKGTHNPVKPPEAEKPAVVPLKEGETIIVKGPPPPKTRQKLVEARPSDDEPMIKLKVKVASSLTSLLKRLAKQDVEEETKNDKKQENESCDSEAVAIGTVCKNHGCEAMYIGPESSISRCQHHPGVAIFHDGYKFWSCCQRRTSDFNEFQRQEGCTTGDHVWTKPFTKVQACRYDWYQVGSSVIISLFAKACLPDKCSFEANATTVKFSMEYENGMHVYEDTIKLHGVVNPARCLVELLGTKVEIKLRKAEPFSWSALRFKEEKPPVKKDNSEEV